MQLWKLVNFRLLLECIIEFILFNKVVKKLHVTKLHAALAERDWKNLRTIA